MLKILFRKEKKKTRKTALRAKSKKSTPRATNGKGRKRAIPKKEEKPNSLKSFFRRSGETPAWIIWTVTGVVAFLYLMAVYFFFFQPYMEGKEEAEIYFIRPQVHGLDISHYQGRIDWEKLSLAAYKEYPINFVFMKATEGLTFVDTMFEINFASARESGLVRGAYHFFRPDVPALQQADLFISQVHLEPGDLPPVLDIEIVGKGGTEALQQGAKVWLNRVEEHYGVKPIIYASYKFKLRHLDDPVFDDYPYWIAHYYVSTLKYKGAWKFWQHTDLGKLDGINGEVDLDIFNGNLEELMQFTLKEQQ